jgi:hypothetical protein
VGEVIYFNVMLKVLPSVTPFNYKQGFMHSYNSEIEAINDLRSRGYVSDFNLMSHSLYCPQLNVHVAPDEFEIAEVYRFEGESDPSDEVVVYAIRSTIRKLYGILINAYGIYAERSSDELVKKLAFISDPR